MTRHIAPNTWRPSEGINLDDATLEIVMFSESSVIVAGPGAGKTELLAQRASFLLQTNLCPAPRRILAISFKRDAAKNLRDRVHARVGAELAGRLDSFTFEAFAKGLVDRFSQALPEWCRPSRDYKIIFPGFGDWSEFAQSRTYGINGQQVQRAHTHLAGGGPLPLVQPEPGDLLQLAALEWWEQCLSENPPELTFGMISVLAMTILQHNPMIASALQRTYSHVFLDEFQDTTGLQYRLVEEAFRDTSAILTAVGDTKQRIMTWAGALPHNFESFAADFAAAKKTLAANFRSIPRIVQIVNAMAEQIEPTAIPVVSARPDATPLNPSDGVIQYDNEAQEAQHLAAWIASEVEAQLLQPNDYLLLVRQLAANVEQGLAGQFAVHGLSIRNEARSVGSLAIQELMTEPLSDLVIAVIQMAIGDRTDAPFQRAWDMLAEAYGLDEERPAHQLRLEGAIRNMATKVRDVISVVESPSDVNFLEFFVNVFAETLGTEVLAQLSEDYENEIRLADVISSVTAFLAECSASSMDWQRLVDIYLGRSQIRLMTVHKAKGLEAHTVFFLHLQNNAFNANLKEADEKFTFFVAASRARDRFFVTTTSPSRNRVQALWAMVEAAQMPTLTPLSS